MNVVIVRPDGAQQLQVQSPDEHSDLEIPVTHMRTIVLGRNVDRQPDEGEYVAFWSILDRVQHEDEWHRLFGHINGPHARLRALLFEKAEVEPELPCEVLNLDGVSVVRVDLDAHEPGTVVYVPERHIP